MHSAGDPSATIADFHFSPGTLTIRVGDTVTWTNRGPSSHTATARDGSFNTGLLQKGASASVTFHQAGTFNYYCQIHPFMHGAIVVLARAAPSGATPTATAPTSTAAASAPITPAPSSGGPAAARTASTAGARSLPVTGLSTTTGLTLALGMVMFGLLLRRVVGR